MHWATAYIGIPWVKGVYDCWAFFRQVQAERYGIDVPAIGGVDTDDRLATARLFSSHPERGAWHRVDVPREGDAVLLARAQHPIHVGVWIVTSDETAGVLHCTQGAGVVFQVPEALRLAGWGKLEFYRHG